MIGSGGNSGEACEALRDAVARKVMGWKAERIEWAYAGTTLVWHDSDGVPMLTCYSWQPDLRDAQTMEVVDRMLELGFDFAMGAGEGLAFAAFGAGAASTRVEHRDRRIAVLRAALGAVSAGRAG